ncbi:MAG: tRNA (5-methylaminomethyl-2-thiouridine)(34)-methyltransferase MnmD [Proteobacteria bacterium]|nr:tRNA (5-methylaminomethyl-2-thiouridine)(34)-methyltransferase MnmD [Pseudomonadota bacterium]
MYIDKNGVPVSKQFDDVYFSAHGGLEESLYVYINGNNLRERFEAMQPDDELCIVELGFGTGLNCLATLNLWSNLAPSSAKLNYHAIEGFPLNKEEIRQALALFPMCNAEVTQLLDVYPAKPYGICKLLFAEHICITLHFAMVDEALVQLPDSVDAWYLDGFSPKLNPDMWRTEIFTHMYRTSNVHATFSTFTAASSVRRGLESAGFIVQKRQGFAHKREHLLGYKSHE